MNFFIDDLNDEQKEAVISEGRPQLVLSGAGSGKTRVLIKYFIYNNNLLYFKSNFIF